MPLQGTLNAIVYGLDKKMVVRYRRCCGCRRRRRLSSAVLSSQRQTDDTTTYLMSEHSDNSDPSTYGMRISGSVRTVNWAAVCVCMPEWWSWLLLVLCVPDL